MTIKERLYIPIGICLSILALLRISYWRLLYGRNNKIRVEGGGIRRVSLRIRGKGKGNLILIKRGSYIDNVRIELGGDNNKIIIGERVRILAGKEIKLFGSDGYLEIGNRTIIHDAIFHLKDNSHIRLGEDCLLASHVSFRATDGHHIYDMETGETINSGGNIIVGNHVWFGYGAVILKDTVIGDNCIIGTQTVVAKKVLPTNSVSVGNPSHVIRENVGWK